MANSKFEYFKAKKEGTTQRPRKTLIPRENHCSADYIFPSHRIGCPVYCSYCVLEGTLISTPTGQVPVEQIQDGDAVLAYDSSSEQLVSAHVQGTASREVQELIELQVDGGSILVSPEHPFLVERGNSTEWVEAQHLTEDDALRCDDKALVQHHYLHQALSQETTHEGVCDEHALSFAGREP